MKILSVTSLAIPDVKIIRNARIGDSRGYFLEVFRDEQLVTHPELASLSGKHIVQSNESRSASGVIRGLHLQRSPDLDKLIRIVSGRIIDVAVDIRLSSSTFGKAVAYELAYDPTAPYEDLILVPFGFAHGLFILEDARVQYFQTGVWNGAGEISITPLAPDIDWSLIDPTLMNQIQTTLSHAQLADKDKAGLTLSDWKTHTLAF